MLAATSSAADVGGPHLDRPHEEVGGERRHAPRRGLLEEVEQGLGVYDRDQLEVELDGSAGWVGAVPLFAVCEVRRHLDLPLVARLHTQERLAKAGDG